jgi:iron(III) transport system substrate-binding protein
VDGDRRRSAGVHDQYEIPEREQSQRPASWNDLLAAPYKNMLQMADARTSGTAVTRIFSVLEVNGRDENKAFDYMKKLRPNVQLYTKSGGGGTLPVGLGQAGGGIFFIVDALDTKAKGYDVTISFPKEGIGTAAEGIALIKGAKNPALGKKLIDWATSPAMQNQFANYKINFVPRHPDVAIEPSLAAVLKGANIFAIDPAYAGANRKKIVDRWVAEF